MATIDINVSIQRALDELNGSVDYDEKMVVDEEITEKGYLILPQGFNMRAGAATDIGTATPLSSATKMTILYLNWKHLMINGMSSDRAMKVAWIRVGLLCCRALFTRDNDDTIPRFCYKPEIRYVAVPDAFSTRYKQMRIKVKSEDLVQALRTMMPTSLKIALTLTKKLSA